MGKPHIYSSAIVIYDKDRRKVLSVKRPLDDESHPGDWGFPAATRRSPSESWEDIAIKAGKDKLGVDIEIVKFIGEDTSDRGNYIITLRDYEARVVSGTPKVPQPADGHTQYIDMKYTDDFDPFIESVKHGALCTKIFLRDKGIEVTC